MTELSDVQLRLAEIPLQLTQARADLVEAQAEIAESEAALRNAEKLKSALESGDIDVEDVEFASAIKKTMWPG